MQCKFSSRAIIEKNRIHVLGMEFRFFHLDKYVVGTLSNAHYSQQ